MPVTAKTLLIISGGVEAVPIIAQAKSMGLKVIVSDGNPKAPGFSIADLSIIASTYDAQKTRELAVELNRKVRIDGVISAAADVPCTVAAVAQALGLNGPSESSARIVADKLLMKETFSAYGIRVPWFSAVESAKHLEEIRRADGRSLVVKPVDSRGARGVVRLLEGVDTAWAYAESLRNSPSGRVMAEEWVAGRQISSESIVCGGSVVTPGLSDRNYQYLERFAPYVIEDGGDLPAELTGEERREIDLLVAEIAGCLSVKAGTIKGDLVMTDQGPLVIEAALRLSGGYFSSHTIPLSTGSNILEAAILMALGVEIDTAGYAPAFRRDICQRFIFPQPGVVRKVVTPPADRDGLVMMAVYAKQGDIVTDITSHPCRAGMIITGGGSRAEARRTAQEVLDGISIEVGPPVPA